MKLIVLSDIHYEFYPAICDMWLTVGLPEKDYSDTTLVLAGDIATPTTFGLFLQYGKFVEKFKQTVIILGNHDYYGEEVGHAIQAYRHAASEYDNVHILTYDKPLELDGVLFVGDTLWTDMAGGDGYSMHMAEKYMNDYRKIVIKRGGQIYRMVAEDTTAMNKLASKRMYESIENSHLPVVVVSHHTPSVLSKGGHGGNELDPAYHNMHNQYVAKMLEHPKVKLWIHGHTHHQVDYILDSGVRVYSNPKGYPGERDVKPIFTKEIVLDV